MQTILREGKLSGNETSAKNQPSLCPCMNFDLHNIITVLSILSKYNYSHPWWTKKMALSAKTTCISYPILVSHNYFQDLSDAVPHAKQHTPPLLCIEGTITNIKEMCIVCERKIITLNLQANICSGLLALIATYHLYNLEYPKVVAPLMKFLEEKLAAAPVTTKTGITYNNLFRTITLLEQRTEAH